MTQTFGKKCDIDLTARQNKLINGAIDPFKESRLLDERTAKMLTAKDPKTPKILHETKDS